MSFVGTKDFLLEVSRGNVTGMKSYTIPGRKDSISNSVLDDITQIPGVTFISDPGGDQLEIFSSVAADSSSGTGVRTLEIEYLDTSGNEQAETVTMSGTGTVTTSATDINKVRWMHGVSVGSGNVAAGNITLQSSGGTAFEYITAGGNQSLSCRFPVSSTQVAYIMGWQVSGITKKIDFRLRATVDRFTRTAQAAYNFQDATVLLDNPSGYIPFPAPLKCPSCSAIKVSGISAAAGGDAGAQFDVLLVSC